MKYVVAFVLLLFAALSINACGLPQISQASLPTPTTPPLPPTVAGDSGTDASDPESQTDPSIPSAQLDPLNIPSPQIPNIESIEQRADPTLQPTSPARIPGTLWENHTLLADTSPEQAVALQHMLDNVAFSDTNPGLVLYIYAPGKGDWVAARGLANHQTQQVIKTGDRFRIASLTKTFVATVVLQLVQEGMLGLEDSVDQWLPGIVPNGEHITIRHLLTHTSGLYDYLDAGFEHLYFSEDPIRVWAPSEMVAYGVSHNPYFAPGEHGRWKYSNTNYVLLGMIIEKVTETPLAQVLHSSIFEPLGMHNTFLEDYEEIPGGFVHGYIGSDDYTYASLCVWAAGGIVSNAEEVATFTHALFTGKLLNEAMMNELLNFTKVDFPNSSGYPLYGMGITRNIEALASATAGIAPNKTQFDAVWGHIGGLSGFKSVLAYHPDSGAVVVVLLNQMYEPVVPIAIEALQIVTSP